MKKLLQKLFVGGIGVSLMVACSAESADEEMATLNATTSTMLVQDLSMNDLVGRWEIDSMISDTEVDLNFDQVTSTNILDETDCFDPVFFQFEADGNVSTKQARLKISSTEFSCRKTGDYEAKYQISGNELTVTFTVDGIQYTETKTVSRYSENGEEFLRVTLTEQETDSAVYVTNDPGNTVASDIQQINMVYKKVEVE